MLNQENLLQCQESVALELWPILLQPLPQISVIEGSLWQSKKTELPLPSSHKELQWFCRWAGHLHVYLAYPTSLCWNSRWVQPRDHGLPSFTRPHLYRDGSIPGIASQEPWGLSPSSYLTHLAEVPQHNTQAKKTRGYHPCPPPCSWTMSVTPKKHRAVSLLPSPEQWYKEAEMKERCYYWPYKYKN